MADDKELDAATILQAALTNVTNAATELEAIGLFPPAEAAKDLRLATVTALATVAAAQAQLATALILRDAAMDGEVLVTAAETETYEAGQLAEISWALNEACAAHGHREPAEWRLSLNGKPGGWWMTKSGMSIPPRHASDVVLLKLVPEESACDLNLERARSVAVALEEQDARLRQRIGELLSSDTGTAVHENTSEGTRFVNTLRQIMLAGDAS